MGHRQFIETAYSEINVFPAISKKQWTTTHFSRMARSLEQSSRETFKKHQNSGTTGKAFMLAKPSSHWCFKSFCKL